MGTDIQNPDGPAQELDFISIANGQRLKWDPLLVVRGGDDVSACPALKKSRSAADMVGMMMGLKHGNELQSTRLQPGDDGVRDGWIDDDGLIAMHPYPDDVVVEDGNWVDAINRGGHRHR